MSQPASGATGDVVEVAPNSVRVWTGYRLPELKQETFFQKLGSIFCPGTVQIQAPVGLTAYLPSVLPATKADGLPDEIALVFYREGQTEADNTYHLAKKTVGGRAYSDLHQLVFDLARSRSGFPARFTGTVAPEGRYYLFDHRLDWQHGIANVFVGARKREQTTDQFLEMLSRWLRAVQERAVQERGGPDGAIAVTSADYVVFWEHWPNAEAASRSTIGELDELTDSAYQQSIPPYNLPAGLWDVDDGVKVLGGESFNFRFGRYRPRD